jgi:hypothetical protein
MRSDSGVTRGINPQKHKGYTNPAQQFLKSQADQECNMVESYITRHAPNSVIISRVLNSKPTDMVTAPSAKLHI